MDHQFCMTCYEMQRSIADSEEEVKELAESCPSSTAEACQISYLLDIARSGLLTSRKLLEQHEHASCDRRWGHPSSGDIINNLLAKAIYSAEKSVR